MTSTRLDPLDVARKARQALLDKKGENVVVLDVRGLSSVTDYYVIATGHTPPHIKALANEMDRVLESVGVSRYRLAGSAESLWVCADYLDVVVHLFSPDARDYYALESLWRDAKVVA